MGMKKKRGKRKPKKKMEEILKSKKKLTMNRLL
jgi:hypothetical protein